jgi:hypothetical protein
MSDDPNTPGGRSQDSCATRIRNIGDLALNDVTAVQHDSDRDFFNQHPDRSCYVRHLLAHERHDWLARGAAFDQPGTTALVVVKQFANNGFRVRLPVTFYPAGLEPEIFSNAEAETIFDAQIAHHRLEDPKGEIVTMRVALERFEQAVMQARRKMR